MSKIWNLITAAVILAGFYAVVVDPARTRTLKQQKALNDTWTCRNLTTVIKIHPLDCCRYPRFIDDKDDAVRECAAYCRSIPYPEFWCQRVCILRLNGFLVDTQTARFFYIANLIGSFVNQSYTQVESPKASREGRLMSTAWGGVVKTSIDSCKHFFPLFANSTTKLVKEDEYEYHYNLLVECTRRQNFLSCPKFHWKADKAGDCEKLKSDMPKCGPQHFSVIHMLLYEKFYDQNHTSSVGEVVRGYNHTTLPPGDAEDDGNDAVKTTEKSKSDQKTAQAQSSTQLVTTTTSLASTTKMTTITSTSTTLQTTQKPTETEAPKSTTHRAVQEATEKPSTEEHSSTVSYGEDGHTSGSETPEQTEQRSTQSGPNHGPRGAGQGYQHSAHDSPNHGPRGGGKNSQNSNHEHSSQGHHNATSNQVQNQDNQHSGARNNTHKNPSSQHKQEHQQSAASKAPVAHAQGSHTTAAAPLKSTQLQGADVSLSAADVTTKRRKQATADAGETDVSKGKGRKRRALTVAGSADGGDDVKND